MIVLIRTDETRDIDIGDDDNPNVITVPWMKLPAGVSWKASTTDHGVVRVHFERNGRTWNLMLNDFGSLGGVPSFVAEGDKRVLAFLRLRLGDANVVRFLVALRNNAAVRNRAKALGYRVRRNDAGKVVNVYSPLVTCGRSSLDWNDEEPEDATEIVGYE